jgi:hypothetical protein
MSFFISFDPCRFEVYFVHDKYCYSCLFSGAIGLVNLLPAFHPKPMLISINEMGLLQGTNCWIILFNLVCQTVPFGGGIYQLTLSISTDRYVVIPVI